MSINNNSYFTQYESPNIVIVPTMDCSPPVKRQKMENNIVVPIVDDATFNKQKLIEKSDQSNVMHAAKNETAKKLNVQSPSTVKKNSWATNYLQSIGLGQKSSIWHHKIPRKNISQSANICINTTGVPKSHSDNAAMKTGVPKSHSDNAPINKSNNLKENKHVSNTIQINDKPYSETKNLLPPQEIIKKTKEEKDCLKDKRLRNQTTKSVVLKNVKDLKSGENSVTELNDKKKQSTNSMIPNDDKTKRNYLTKRNNLKQRTNSNDNNNLNVKSNNLYKQSEKEIVTALKKNKNSKVLAEQFKQFKNSKRDNTDSKLSLKTKESVTETSRERKSKRRQYISSSDLRDDVKKTLKKHQSTIGEITSVRRILKVTKKYDINDLNRLNATKNNNISTCTKKRIIKTCKEEEMRKSTKVKSPRKKINLKTSSPKCKQISDSPIKKKARNTKNYRKIKLVINVICNEASSRHCNSNNIADSKKECAASNVELDFLNDFNIDEIIESLDKCDQEINENHDVNSSSIPMFANNETDATDLLKILKGEEDDDFITQSLINTNDLLFGCKFSNTQNTEPYNETNNLIQDSNSDMSKNIIEIPSKIKREKLDIFPESEQNNLSKRKIGIEKKQSENNICECNCEINISIQGSNGDMSKNSIEIPTKIKEEMLDMFSESEQNNLFQVKIGEEKQTENIICERNHEPINLVKENNSVTSKCRDHCSDVKKNPLVISAKTSERSIVHVGTTKIKDVLAQEIINESAKHNSCWRNVIKPIPGESNVEAKEKVMYYNNFTPKTQEAYDNTKKHYEIHVNDQSKETEVEDEKAKTSEFQNVVKYENNEKNILTKSIEHFTKEKDSEVCKNIKADADFSDNTVTIIQSKEDEIQYFPKQPKNNNTILIEQGHTLKVVDNTEKVVLHSNTEESACPKNDTRNDKNSRKDLYNMKDIVSSQVINTGDKKGKNGIKEKCFDDKRQEAPITEKQDSNMSSCSKSLNLEDNVNNEKNFNKKSQDVQHLPNKSSPPVSVKKYADDLDVALSSPTFKVNEKIAKQLQENIFTSLKIKYSITSLLHQGQFSTIFKCKHPTGKNYALKILANSKQSIETKKEMWMSLQYYIPRKNVFTVYLVNAFKFEAKWYILMDYYPKNLAQVLKETGKSFCVETIQDYARQLVNAVMFLKNNNMIHSDIKPKHILLNSSNNNLKLCGLDTLCYVNKLPTLPNVGTVNYRAPEIILGYPAGFEIDVWSTGVVLFEIATNQKLFPGTYNNQILYKQICTLGYVPCDMISKSRYASNHFNGTKFMRRMGPAGKEIHLINKFMRNNKLSYEIFNAYYSNWRCFRSTIELNDDLEKLSMFVNLLQKILVIHPRHRLSIEFVYGNQFIYDAYKYNEW